MLINLTLLMHEVEHSMLIALQSATDPLTVSDEKFKQLVDDHRSMKDILITLDNMPDVVVEVQGDEYFTIPFPR